MVENVIIMVTGILGCFRLEEVEAALAEHAVDDPEEIASMVAM